MNVCCEQMGAIVPIPMHWITFYNTKYVDTHGYGTFLAERQPMVVAFNKNY